LRVPYFDAALLTFPSASSVPIFDVRHLAKQPFAGAKEVDVRPLIRLSVTRENTWQRNHPD